MASSIVRTIQSLYACILVFLWSVPLMKCSCTNPLRQPSITEHSTPQSPLTLSSQSITAALHPLRISLSIWRKMNEKRRMVPCPYGPIVNLPIRSFHIPPTLLSIDKRADGPKSEASYKPITILSEASTRQCRSLNHLDPIAPISLMTGACYMSKPAATLCI